MTEGANQTFAGLGNRGHTMNYRINPSCNEGLLRDNIDNIYESPPSPSMTNVSSGGKGKGDGDKVKSKKKDAPTIPPKQELQKTKEDPLNIPPDLQETKDAPIPPDLQQTQQAEDREKEDDLDKKNDGELQVPIL